MALIEIELRSATATTSFDRAFAGLSALSRPGADAAAQSIALLRAQLGVPRTCWLALADGEPVGRIAANPARTDPRTGYVGQFECRPERGDAAALLLQHAAAWLRERGVEKIFGPVDANTWFNYRLASRTYPDAAPWEPLNPAAYRGFFEAALWRVCETYRSVGFDDLAALMRLTQPFAARAQQSGFTWRHFADPIQDSASIHALTLEAFAGQPHFEPTSLAEFRSMYVPSIRGLDLHFGFIVEASDGAPAGYMLTFPQGDSLVIKSTAVSPQFQGEGLGQALAHWAMAQAHARGLLRLIGALIRSDSPSDTKMVRFYQQAARLDWQHDYVLYELPGLGDA